MNKSGRHYAKRTVPGTERKPVHDLVYVFNIKPSGRMVATGDLVGEVNEEREDVDYKL